ncbi:translesion DNA synthesis-associated protein ImuA [Alteromonas sp. D210916BOD_24]|uniref:translesion DNA synthesis-associated protein ImuA n=1 Tax=Alteromonas sp. D210916BOD_24 TaxID=3157618 RepID=UPI00399CBFE5
MTTSLSAINSHPHIWRARQHNTNETKFSLGFPSLDKALNGGVASTGLIRVSSLLGVGELTLFKHVLCSQRTHKMVVFVSPPGYLQSPWLTNLGLDLQQILVVNTHSEQESLWAAEQCLKSTACHCVVLWSSQISATQARRLQVAATHNDALCLLFTTERYASKEALPVALDIALQAQHDTLRVQVRKQRHGWPVDNITVQHHWTPDNRPIKWAMAHNKLQDHILHSVS